MSFSLGPIVTNQHLIPLNNLVQERLTFPFILSEQIDHHNHPIFCDPLSVVAELSEHKPASSLILLFRWTALQNTGLHISDYIWYLSSTIESLFDHSNSHPSHHKCTLCHTLQNSWIRQRTIHAVNFSSLKTSISCR